MKRKLMLVDDEEKSLFHLLYHSLRPETWDLIPVANATQAIAESRTGGIDLILMAVDSRASERWNAIDEITEANPFLPVIAVTTQTGLENLAEAVGVRALVKRPVDVPALVQMMRRLLGEQIEKQSHNEPTNEAGIDGLSANSAVFVENLQRRYTTPYIMPTPLRQWGINE